jgi:hypothetical protein
MPKPGTECAVVDRATNLQQQIGAASRPSHLLRFIRSAVHQEVGRSFGDRGSDPQSGTVAFGVVDQPVALPREPSGAIIFAIFFSGNGARASTMVRKAANIAAVNSGAMMSQTMMRHRTCRAIDDRNLAKLAGDAEASTIRVPPTGL